MTSRDRVGEKNFYGLIQGTVNSIAHGEHPLLSMTPILVTKDNKIFMVVSSLGGSRIITITLQTALNVINHGMAPQESNRCATHPPTTSVVAG